MNNNINTPWGPVGYVTYKRTYSRPMPDGKSEDWKDTVERVIKACRDQLHCGFEHEEEKFLYDTMMNLKGTVAGRFLWQLGTKTVDRLGLPSLQNCSFVVVDNPVRPFTWAFEMLMLGSGVGFNIQREHVYQIPKVLSTVHIERLDKNDADFIVPDSREGWVELLKRVMESSFITGKGFSFATHLIRSKGTPIKGFGGTASGPEDLVWGMMEINKILNSRAGSKIRPIDALDIMNIIGRIVVAGNVRRSAQIAIGDCDDMEYLMAKRWDLGGIPNWRAMSNNSVVCDDVSKLPEIFWEGYKGNGEPYGLINLASSRIMGRTGETQYPDPDVMGYNPCQPGFATLMTTQGIKRFDEISIGDLIWSKSGWTKVVNKWSTGIKSVYEYRTSGGVFVGTSNHRLDTEIGKIEADAAESVLTISCPEIVKISWDYQTVMDGLFLGDGYYKRQEGRDTSYSCLCVGQNDYDYQDSEIAEFIVAEMDKRTVRVVTSITEEEKSRTFNQSIPDRFYLKDPIKAASLLRGLYTANGSVVKQKGNTSRITYKTSSNTMAIQVQQMLSFIGIRSYITTNKAKDVKFENGTYTCKESYDVNITRDAEIFKNIVGFIQKYKMDKITATQRDGSVRNDMYTSMMSKSYLGDFEVFDITVDNDSHTYWTGGLSVSNCAEQSLANYETCCLAEIYLPNIDSYEEFVDVAKILYRINKHSLAIPCEIKETEDIVHKNMRMGIGVTGYLQATPRQRGWLPMAYDELREYDAIYSQRNGFPKSIKITTVKPSGTLSLLAGVTSGAHPAYSQYYIRRIRMASDMPLVATCRENGFHVEYQRNFDGTEDHSTVVVSFPCKVPVGTMLAKNMTAIDQLNVIKKLQQEWSDNSVSVTIYYRVEELDDIKVWLSENYANVKSVSFLLHNDHGFDQAPLEEITEDQYNEMSAKCTPINSIDQLSLESLDIEDCAGGACPVR